MPALSMMVAPTPDGWGVFLSDGRQLAGFRDVFRGSPIKRVGRDRFVRNVLIAVGNSGDAELSAVAETLLDVGVAVSDTLTMRRIVLPAVSDVVYPVEVVDVDIAVAPVEPAAPIIAPTRNCPRLLRHRNGQCTRVCAPYEENFALTVIADSRPCHFPMFRS